MYTPHEDDEEEMGHTEVTKSVIFALRACCPTQSVRRAGRRRPSFDDSDHGGGSFTHTRRARDHRARTFASTSNAFEPEEPMPPAFEDKCGVALAGSSARSCQNTSKYFPSRPMASYYNQSFTRIDAAVAHSLGLESVYLDEAAPSPLSAALTAQLPAHKRGRHLANTATKYHNMALLIPPHYPAAACRLRSHSQRSLCSSSSLASNPGHTSAPSRPMRRSTDNGIHSSM
ncbi:hypothetical protein D9619_013564 [Psilocybe cf. subviscida]|uniref:Uncharacterized protein n=1 Tax=Psilocybe cf. subviscida TaxID=2480587 RepID=A0A8H5AQA3_9AGAR|nr:hypothetical protein D9619_013564 [Psilocybe cf. subviscida]